MRISDWSSDVCSSDLDLVWRLFGNKADELDILWLGAPPDGATRNAATLVLSPDPALRAKMPRVDDPAGVPVYVVDPHGFVILRYAPGFGPAGSRADRATLLSLIVVLASSCRVKTNRGPP